MSYTLPMHITPWENWYHCICNTHATWLVGDPRGWRSYKGRYHVEYDYKNPPPDGMYDAFITT